MNDYKQYLNCARAREIDMVDYLARAGCYPQRIRRLDYRYRPPLRVEKSSFI